MKKFWKKKEPAAKSEAPADGELLAYLDGELAPERQSEIQQLLESDWKLRVRLTEIERDIETYVKATHPQRQIELPPFDDLWRGVSSRLADPLEPLPVEMELRLRKREAMGLVTLVRRWSDALLRRPVLRRWSVAATIGLTITAGLAFWFLSSEHLCVVSAEELIERATQSEAAQTKQVAEPVVYRRIQVKRTGAGESVIWESWRETGKNQFWQRVADRQGWRDFNRPNDRAMPALIAEIEAIFRINHLDSRRPLSAAAFAEWRKTIRSKSETVTELALPGNKANDGLKLTTVPQEPYALNAIIEASLVVRRSDWHVVTQRLKAQGENEVREYELSEMAYEVLPLQALTVFAELAPAPLSTATIPPSPSLGGDMAAPSPSPTVAPTETALKDAEVGALFALHQMQADLGEQIEVTRDPAGRIVVRGLVETPERRQQLSEALRHLPLVVVRLHTVEEAARQAALKQSSRATQSPPVNDSVNAVTSTAPGANAFEQRLARYFTERESAGNDRQNINLKIARLSNEVVSESSAALSEAWALRRLLERFAAEKDEDRSIAARQRIEEMAANYIVRLKTQSRRLRMRLEPVLISIAGAKAPVVSAPSPSEPTKQAQALSVFKAVEQTQQMTHHLFAGTGSAASPEEAARQLLEALARLDQALLRF